ncbi:MAG: tetratricopeptide repeat protein [Planctomycetia bacterium]|nr:tetratricopeptide repeat protein [Planctomycetia bacterium]
MNVRRATALLPSGTLLAACVLGACGALVPTAAARCRVYESGVSVWRDTARKQPASARASANWALAILHGGPAEPAPAAILMARRLLERAVEIDPGGHLGLVDLAVLVRGEDPDRAIDLCRRAVALRPRHAGGHHVLGTLLVGRDPAAAERHLTIAAELAPREPDTLVNLANLLLAGGNPGRAVPLYRRALEIDPGHRLAAHNLAVATGAAGGDSR